MEGPILIHGHSFRAEWASQLVRSRLKEFWLTRPEDDLAWDGVKGGREELLDGIKEDHLPKVPDIVRDIKDESTSYKVGIVGAGVAGLFTAMTIDYLNEKVPNLGFTYELLEAAPETRFGGRLYTHKFSDAPHDYYDVGAMRFPDIPVMKRTFDLFLNELNFEKSAEPQTSGEPLSGPIKLIPYYLKGNNCPNYYNDIYYSKPPVGINDPFKVQSKRGDDQIPEEFLKKGSDGPGFALKAAIEPFKKALRKEIETKNNEGWDFLMKADKYSVRQYLSRTDDGKAEGLPEGLGYNIRTIEWMETFGSGTLNYDEAFSEVVIGSLDFDYYSGDPSIVVDWYCLEGGTQQVAEAMRKKLKQAGPKFNSRVTMIKREPEREGQNDMIVRVGPAKDDEKDEDRRYYSAVFVSTTLAAMQRMDLTGATLNYGTKVAIRSLRYGTSCKVGIKFDEPWWIKDLKIDLGGVAQTDLPLRMCVYPSYNIKDGHKNKAVLLCSYTWGQDAQRFAALISKENKTTKEKQEADEELKEVLCHDLALLHCPQKNGEKDEAAYQALYKKIKKLYIEHHAYDWGADKHMSGAFAHFGPGQFAKMYTDIIFPHAGGKLFIIGEAASKHHAWIVGALESAVRGVYQLLQEYKGSKTKEVEEALQILENPKKGRSPYLIPDEENREVVRQQLYIAKVREEAKRDTPRLPQSP